MTGFLDKLPGNVSRALVDIAHERLRQTTAEGWTHEHDDEHAVGEMAMAGAAYAIGDDLPNRAEQIWPWDMRWWKPTERRRNLVKSAALILAEIERFDRVNSARDMVRPIRLPNNPLT